MLCQSARICGRRGLLFRSADRRAGPCPLMLQRPRTSFRKSECTREPGQRVAPGDSWEAAPLQSGQWGGCPLGSVDSIKPLAPAGRLPTT